MSTKRTCQSCYKIFEESVSYWSVYTWYQQRYCPPCRERVDRRFSDAMGERETSGEEVGND